MALGSRKETKAVVERRGAVQGLESLALQPVAAAIASWLTVEQPEETGT